MRRLRFSTADVLRFALSIHVQNSDRRLEPRPQRVLVVDDYADLRTMWRLWLNMWGFQVTGAADGTAATGVAPRHCRQSGPGPTCCGAPAAAAMSRG